MSETSKPPAAPKDAILDDRLLGHCKKVFDAVAGLRAAAVPRPVAEIDPNTRSGGVLSRTSRYAARLDAELLKLPDDKARRKFLDCERNKWIDRFETFQGDVLAGTYNGDATAFDYAITIADIESRRACFAPVKPRLVRDGGRNS